MIPTVLIERLLTLAHDIVADGHARNDSACVQLGGALAILGGMLTRPYHVAVLLHQIAPLIRSWTQTLRQSVADAPHGRN